MTSLQGTTPANTFGNLLQVSNSNNGVDSTLRDVEDGKGTISALQLSTDEVRFQNGGTAAVYAQFNDVGKLLFNSATSLTTGQGNAGEIQVNGQDGSETAISIARASGDTGGGNFSINKARGTIAAPIVAVDGDTVGTITFSAHNGTDFDNPAVNMKVTLDGTVSGDTLPGKLEISNDGLVSSVHNADNFVQFPVGLVIPVYADGTRPTPGTSAGQAPAGTLIFNSDDNFPNVSDGTNWRNMSGAAT